MSDIGVGRPPTPPDLSSRAAQPPARAPMPPPPAPPVPGNPYGTGTVAPSAGPDASSGRAEVAADQAKQVASTAADGARDVAGEAREQAGQVLEEARYQGRHLVHETRRELRDQASQQAERAAEGLRNVANQIQALGGGRPEEAGAVGEYVGQLGERAQELAARIQTQGLDGMIDDVRRVARRRPGMFLAGAAAAGFAVGRMLRASAGSDAGSNGRPAGRHWAGERDDGRSANGYAPQPAAYPPATGYGPSADALGPAGTADSGERPLYGAAPAATPAYAERPYGDPAHGAAIYHDSAYGERRV